MVESNKSEELDSLLSWLEGFSQLRGVASGHYGRHAKVGFGRFSHAYSADLGIAIRLKEGAIEVLKHVEEQFIPDPIKEFLRSESD